MRGNTTYEVGTFQRGTWKVASIHDNRELAVLEARHIWQSGRYAGVRVVMDQFDERTGTYFPKTVFRTSKVDDVNYDTLERQKKLRREARWARESREAEFAGGASYGAAPFWQPGPVILTLLLAAIVLAGIAAIIGLRTYFGGL